MRLITCMALAGAALTLALSSQAANAAVYDITANETSAFGPETISIDLDTAGAVVSNGQTSFLDTTVKINGVLQPSDVFTTTTNNIGGSSFFFVDTNTPDPKAFYSGSGESTVFNTGAYIIADGATDGEGTLNISNGQVSAAPEPSTWLLMIAGVGGIGLMLRRAKKTAGFRFKNAFAA